MVYSDLMTTIQSLSQSKKLNLGFDLVIQLLPCLSSGTEFRLQLENHGVKLELKGAFNLGWLNESQCFLNGDGIILRIERNTQLRLSRGEAGEFRLEDSRSNTSLSIDCSGWSERILQEIVEEQELRNSSHSGVHWNRFSQSIPERRRLRILPPRCLLFDAPYELLDKANTMGESIVAQVGNPFAALVIRGTPTKINTDSEKLGVYRFSSERNEALMTVNFPSVTDVMRANSAVHGAGIELRDLDRRCLMRLFAETTQQNAETSRECAVWLESLLCCTRQCPRYDSQEQ